MIGIQVDVEEVDQEIVLEIEVVIEIEDLEGRAVEVVREIDVVAREVEKGIGKGIEKEK